MLDGFTIVVGHEIEETITDPGAEDVINGQNLGGWYDYAAYENGDKCAWVGYNFGITAPSTVPGGLNKVEALSLKQVADDLLSRHPLRLGHRGDSSRRTSLA